MWFNEPHLKVAALEELTQQHQYNQDCYGAIENMDRAVGKLLAYLQEKGLEKETVVL